MARFKPRSVNESPLVPLPTNAYIPQRDLDKAPILEVSHLGIDFGGLTAVNDLNLTVGRTEIAGLIGPNGAGKTTVFNLLTKVYQPTRGSIIAAAILTLLPELLRSFADYRMLVYAIVLILVMLGTNNAQLKALFSKLVPAKLRKEAK